MNLNSYISKIEGHGKLNINLKNNSARLEIDEGERLFEALVLGKSYLDVPFITARICGVCPVAHTIASVKGLERALNYTIDPSTEKLRRIILASQIVQSHALHLFFLALPDYLEEIDSTLELSAKAPHLFKIALSIKQFSDKLTTIIGGRNVHPITIIPGGFSKIPNKNDLEKILNEAKKILPMAKKTVQLFSSFTYPKINNKTQYLALANNSYETYDGYISSIDKPEFADIDYQDNLKEKIVPHSTAKFAQFKKAGLMVGAIARISINQNHLKPEATTALKKSIRQLADHFPTYNSFHNNIAQAIELVHFVEEIVDLTQELIDNENYIHIKPDIIVKNGSGVGAIEAPRGTLYHYYELDKTGKIVNCDIITPTVQNLTNIENDMQILLKNNQGKPAEFRQQEIEMLIRAYDPCITCSVH